MSGKQRPDRYDHVFDRLEELRRQTGSVLCVGIDPRLERTPEAVRRRHGDDVEALLYAFGAGVIEAAGGSAAAFKPQIAFFESHGLAGLSAFARLVHEARAKGHLVIADAKRGDIGSTASAYAEAFLEREADFEVDLLTVNPYLGADSLEPFLSVAALAGKGLYVLVRTSNPGGADLQEKQMADGRPLFEHTAELIRGLGEAHLGTEGLSLVGAVVGATTPAAAERLRECLPDTPFLVPGFGAQGATAEDVVANFRSDGSGALVNASRSVIYPPESDLNVDLSWQEAVQQAAEAARAQLTAAMKSVG
jgi:orotidine-5'-phosphate decarboxylase